MYYYYQHYYSPKPRSLVGILIGDIEIDQSVRYIKIQRKTMNLSTRLWGITTEFVGFIQYSFVFLHVSPCCLVLKLEIQKNIFP